jgi:hypothetical protein
MASIVAGAHPPFHSLLLTRYSFLKIRKRTPLYLTPLSPIPSQQGNKTFPRKLVNRERWRERRENKKNKSSAYSWYPFLFIPRIRGIVVFKGTVRSDWICMSKQELTISYEIQLRQCKKASNPPAYSDHGLHVLKPRSFSPNCTQ